MYAPPVFRETRREILHELMRAYPLATLVTAVNGRIKVSLLPFALSMDGEAAVLCAHLSRGNDQIADLRAGSEALILFQGPDAYVSPSWYPSKREGQEAVPTWNYVAVEARGIPRVIEEAGWLRSHLETLTDRHEDGRDGRWYVSDASDDYLAAQLKGIVGLEIPIAHVEGKWKASQNRSAADQAGVVEGLRADGRSDAAAVVDELAGKRRPAGNA